MSFISISFIIFLVLLVPLYYLLPNKYRWILLLICSYVFYSFASIKFFVFLLTSTISTYFVAIALGNINNKEHQYILNTNYSVKEKQVYQNELKKRKKLYLALGIIINIGILIFIKYINFIIYNLNILNIANINKIDIIVPLGISFYTFQVVGYIIDVYRNEFIPEKNIFKYALFVSYFPQFIMGPISKFSLLSKQFYIEHNFNKVYFIQGIQRIILGFFKKLVVADRIGIFVDTIYANYNDYSGTVLLITAILYSIQIYADFSGYMDIAIGTSNCLGINIQENFDAPYFSKSIKEFWTRWHITLYEWFKCYIYIPLGGSKVSTPKTILNLFVVWFLTGLWHGASWNFIIWGLYHGFFVMLCVFYNKYINFKVNIFNKALTFIQIIFTFFIVSIGFIFFRVNSIMDSINIIKKIINFFISEKICFDLFFNVLSVKQLYILIVGILIMILFDIKKIRDVLLKYSIVLSLSIIYILLVFIISFGKFGTTTFIYFRF